MSDESIPEMKARLETRKAEVEQRKGKMELMDDATNLIGEGERLLQVSEAILDLVIIYFESEKKIASDEAAIHRLCSVVDDVRECAVSLRERAEVLQTSVRAIHATVRAPDLSSNKVKATD
jgi:hypothetical protein